MPIIKHYLGQEEEQPHQIETTTDLKRMSEAAKNGDTVIFKKFEPNTEITDQVQVWRDMETNDYFTLTDWRSRFEKTEETNIYMDRDWINDPDFESAKKADSKPKKYYELMLDWTTFYPPKFTKPYAAYIVPKDLEPGTKVIIPTVIEDIVKIIWQGTKSRLFNAKATWTGSDLVIDTESLVIDDYIHRKKDYSNLD